MVLTASPRFPFQALSLGAPRMAPNARRIAAWSAALALHVAMLAMALTPPRPLDLPARPAPAEPMVVVPIEVAVVEPPPLTAEPVRSQPAPAPTSLPVAVLPPLAPTGERPAPPVVDADLFALPSRLPAIEPTTGTLFGLSHAIAIDSVTPPPYPPRAARRGEQGTVMLRVDIGADGVPHAVDIERSSGSVLLDRAARQHVLAKWTFHPAMLDGRPVAATARVPIAFSLD